MSTQIIHFDFNGFELRTLGTWDAPLFVAGDVCSVLELGNVSMACAGLDEDEKGITIVDTLGGKQDLLCITESGLYSLVLRSRKVQAKAFKKWITSEVMPSIRKTGGYQAPAPTLPSLPSMADVAAVQNSIAAFEATGDIQLAQLIKIYMANEILRATQGSPLLQGTEADRPLQLEGAVDAALRLGYSVPKNIEGTLGKFVKKVCGGLLQGKNQRYSQASAKQVPANMYPAQHPDVEAAVRAFFS
jgi:prophage antirepressor-like protein